MQRRKRRAGRCCVRVLPCLQTHTPGKAMMLAARQFRAPAQPTTHTVTIHIVRPSVEVIITNPAIDPRSSLLPRAKEAASAAADRQGAAGHSHTTCCARCYKPELSPRCRRVRWYHRSGRHFLLAFLRVHHRPDGMLAIHTHPDAYATYHTIVLSLAGGTSSLPSSFERRRCQPFQEHRASPRSSARVYAHLQRRRKVVEPPFIASAGNIL